MPFRTSWPREFSISPVDRHALSALEGGPSRSRPSGCHKTLFVQMSTGAQHDYELLASACQEGATSRDVTSTKKGQERSSTLPRYTLSCFAPTCNSCPRLNGDVVGVVSLGSLSDQSCEFDSVPQQCSIKIDHEHLARRHRLGEERHVSPVKGSWRIIALSKTENWATALYGQGSTPAESCE